MGFLFPADQVTAAYTELRERVVVLLRSVDPTCASRRVPHCPAWTVGDLVAHMVGVPDDILNGRLEGVASDAWTQAQVDRRRGMTLVALADEYEAGAPSFDTVLPMIPEPVNSQVVMDAVTHEHDLRFALDSDGARDSLAVRVGVGWLLDMVEGHDPALAARLVGSGIPEWDLLRSLGGRRSAAQMDALGLDGAAIVSRLAGTPLRPPS